MSQFTLGQKWISHAEPDLAMGRISNIEHRTITVSFDICDEQRTYAQAQAPLSRVRFSRGDQVTLINGDQLRITRVSEAQGLLNYHGQLEVADRPDEPSAALPEVSICETELDPNIRFSKPQDRLFTHQFDDNRWFNLRYDTWRHISRLASADSRGLYGPRISLIPHQLYIANEVARRFAPRVLLADEVGLGKTIEAGLIVHQQLQTGRASRILIIVPEALSFQWFVEMIRRFNLSFTVLDEERCFQISSDNSEIDSDDPYAEVFNPFEAQQLMLCSLNLFIENPDRIEQVLDAEWDLVVVDEAHHLHWTPEQESLEYKIVALISQVTQGLLLLTATPEQLGRTGHFARLKLLDPHRFHDYQQFIDEEQQFEVIADAATDLLRGSDSEKLSARTLIQKTLDLSTADSPQSDADLISALLDRHGTGRVLFRNVRSSIKGFPKRIANPYPLQAPSEYTDLGLPYPEASHSNWTKIDTRLPWLAELLLANSKKKFLLICAHKKTAIELEQALKKLINIRVTLFHEGMDLVARDKAANYFSEPERGAQLLICSEIGSEGRNFQFASELILFDLPHSPDLLEQRIGRLDRIGQLSDVNIHIPFFVASYGERLWHFFDESLSVFTSPNPVAQSLFDEFSEQLSLDIGEAEFAEFIDASKLANKKKLSELNRGRDRLLELNSHRREESAKIIEDISKHESDHELEAYMEQSFGLFGLESEYTGSNILTVRPNESVARVNSVSLETLDHFHYPELPEDGIRITYDRDTALSIEDVGFFSWENPIVQQAMDIAISDVTGNSTMIAVKHPQLKAGTLLVEIMYIVDCVAPKKLMADRYLPPRIIRCLITPQLNNMAESFPFQTFNGQQLDIDAATFGKILEQQEKGIKAMLEQAKVFAKVELETLKQQALRQIDLELNNEISRLTELKKVNSSVRNDEIEFLRITLQALHSAISKSDVRMDALRIIVAA